MPVLRRRSPALSPNSGLALALRGIAYEKAGDTKSAIADFRRALQIDPSTKYAKEGLRRLGAASATASANWYSKCSQNKDLDRRIRGCTEIIERGEEESQTNRSKAYYNRGVAYHSQGDYDRAITDYNEAIELDPNSPDVYLFRGRARVRKIDVLGPKCSDGDCLKRVVRDQTKLAIGDYTKVIALNPKSAQAYAGRARAHFLVLDLDAAIGDSNKALEIAPNLAEAYVNRGMAYAGKGKRDRAIADLHKALEIDPSNGLAKHTLKMMGVKP